MACPSLKTTVPKKSLQYGEYLRRDRNERPVSDEGPGTSRLRGTAHPSTPPSECELYARWQPGRICQTTALTSWTLARMLPVQLQNHHTTGMFDIRTTILRRVRLQKQYTVESLFSELVHCRSLSSESVFCGVCIQNEYPAESLYSESVFCGASVFRMSMLRSLCCWSQHTAESQSSESVYCTASSPESVH